MTLLDYTYAEKMNRDVTADLYDTSLDQATADAVVTELTSDADYLEALSDKFSGDAEYLAGVVDALATDATYLAAIVDALAADAPYLAAVGAALAVDATYLPAVAAEVADVLTDDYNTVITAEALSPTAAFDSDPGVTATHTFDPLANLGDGGIYGTSVTVTCTMSDDSTEVFTDSGGVLSGDVDGAGTIDYATGVIVITWGTLSAKTGSTATCTYSFIRDGLVGHSSALDAVTFSQDSEGDVGADKITITAQLKDADGQKWLANTMVSVWLTSDASGFTPYAVTDSVVASAGGILETLTALTSFTCVTTSSGLLSLVVEESGGAVDMYLGVMLPNGKYIVSSIISFGA